MNINIMTNVRGGTARCVAIEKILRGCIGNAIYRSGSIDRAVTAVRDCIALIQSALQPETFQSSWGDDDQVGSATIVIMVDDIPHFSITLSRDNEVKISGGEDWLGSEAEWRKHRSTDIWRLP
jgi:hypothetical protein